MTIEDPRLAILESLLGSHRGSLLRTPLNPYQWTAFVALHEARHTERIREIANKLQGSS